MFKKTVLINVKWKSWFDEENKKSERKEKLLQSMQIDDKPISTKKKKIEKNIHSILSNVYVKLRLYSVLLANCKNSPKTWKILY